MEYKKLIEDKSKFEFPTPNSLSSPVRASRAACQNAFIQGGCYALRLTQSRIEELERENERLKTDKAYLEMKLKLSKR